MFRKIAILSLFVVTLSIIGILAFSNTKDQNPESSAAIKISNFTLNDTYKKEHSLSDYKDSEAILILFIATQCPVSNAYNTRMVELYNQYHDKDIAILGINSNKQENLDECREHAEKHGFEFPVLKDEKNVIADMFEASVTPEAYALNPETYEILYHGRIDDSRNESSIESKDLEDALNEILAGKSVSVDETKAFGCTIKRI